MAVPKKRKSRTKKNISKANWLKKVEPITKKSMSLIKSILKNEIISFIY